jgi:hypothetical protein
LVAVRFLLLYRHLLVAAGQQIIHFTLFASNLTFKLREASLEFAVGSGFLFVSLFGIGKLELSLLSELLQFL